MGTPLDYVASERIHRPLGQNGFMCRAKRQCNEGVKPILMRYQRQDGIPSLSIKLSKIDLSCGSYLHFLPLNITRQKHDVTTKSFQQIHLEEAKVRDKNEDNY